MYALALIRYRRPIDEVVALQHGHRAYLRSLKDNGVLVASGPLDPRYGGALLLHLPDEASEADLDAVRDGDPYYQAGVAQYELLKWNVITGLDDLNRALGPASDTMSSDADPKVIAIGADAESSLSAEDEFAVVRQFDSSIEAELARTALEAAGIYAAVWDEDTQLGPAVQGVRLVVREGDVAHANDILAQAATSQPGEPVS